MSSRDPVPAPSGCMFCAIAQHDADAQIEVVIGTSFVITPLNPVTDGHKLVIPMTHVADARESLSETARVMFNVARYLQREGAGDCNIITSIGAAATQTVGHLHVHIVPRREGDGLLLPWSDLGPSGQVVPPTPSYADEHGDIGGYGGES